MSKTNLMKKKNSIFGTLFVFSILVILEFFKSVSYEEKLDYSVVPNDINIVNLDAPSFQNVEVYFEFVTGRQIVLEMELSNTIEQIKERLALMLEVSVERISLNFQFKALQNERTFDSYGVQNGHVIQVIILKNNYTNINHPIIEVRYTEENTLEDIIPSLQDDFSWVDSTIKLTVGENTYSAIYNADSENYNDFALDIKVVVSKGIQSTPDIPQLDIRNTNSITLVNVIGAEYCMNGGEWQDSNVFTNLSPNTKYTFSIRYKETTDFEASDKSSVDISTSDKKFGQGDTFKRQKCLKILLIICGSTFYFIYNKYKKKENK